MKQLALLLIGLMIVVSCNKENFDPDIDDTNDPYDHGASVGASNRDIVSDVEYGTLLIEIQYFEGYKPEDATITNLKTFISSIVTKPGGIIINQSQITGSGATSYSVNAIRNLEQANRHYNTQGDTMAIYFLFLDAEYSQNTQDSKVLGVAYNNTSMALFQKTIQDYSGGIAQPSAELLETTVINHEFGHILGLVNNNLEMAAAHQDTDHGHHCNNEDCLMYWTAETGDVVTNLVGLSEAPGLDQQCLNDLATLN